MLHTMRILTCIAFGLLPILSFAQQTALPVSIGIIVDSSGSMGAKLARSRQVAAQFLKSASLDDETFLIESSNHPMLASAFTTDPYRMQDRLVFLQAKGRSALWDSVALALAEMKKARYPRQAVILISDGGDNSSNATLESVARLAHDSDVPIYAFGVHDPETSRARTAEEADGPGKLKEVAERSGGRYFAVENINDIPIFTSQLTGGLRSANLPGRAR